MPVGSGSQWFKPTNKLLAVPTISPNCPEWQIPAPNAPAGKSPAPAIIGIPFGNPNSLLTSLLNLPIISVGFTIFGNLLTGIPVKSHIS